MPITTPITEDRMLLTKWVAYSPSRGSMRDRSGGNFRPPPGSNREPRISGITRRPISAGIMSLPRISDSVL